MKRGNIGALILAAGFSSRMGSFKPLVEIGGKSFVERNIELFSQSGVSKIITVAGYKAEDLKKVIADTPSQCVINENYTEGMFSSIRKGAEILHHNCDGFFLLPVDIPLVSSTTLENLLHTFFSVSCRICYPVYSGRRGHPPLIHADLIPQILSFRGDGGLRKLLHEYDQAVIDVEVEDPFILRDIDTKEDYDAVAKMITKDGIQ